MTRTQLNSKWLFMGLTFYLCSTLISMAAMSTGVGILFILALYSGWRPKHLVDTIKLSSSNGVFAILSLALTVICLLSLIISKLAPITLAGHVPTVHLLQDGSKLWYFVLPFFLASILKALSPLERKNALTAWLSFGGVLGVLGIIQFFTGFPRKQIIPSQPEFFHATLFFGHHLSSSSILIFPFLVSLVLSLSPHLKDQKIKLICRATSVTLGITLILTWSRMLWIALPCGLLVLAFRSIRPKFRKLFLVLGSTVITAFLVLATLNMTTIESKLFNQRGTNERTALWEANIAFIHMRPLSGIGFRKTQEMSYYYFLEKDPLNAKNKFIGHAHNNALEVIAGTGFIGFLVWCLWNFWIFKTSNTLIRSKLNQKLFIESDIVLALFCAWIILHINGITQVNFWEGKVMHQMMWALSIILFLNQSSLDSDTLISATNKNSGS